MQEKNKQKVWFNNILFVGIQVNRNPYSVTVSAAKGAAANVAPAQSKSAIHFREVFYSTTEIFTSSVKASFII